MTPHWLNFSTVESERELVSHHYAVHHTTCFYYIYHHDDMLIDLSCPISLYLPRKNQFANIYTMRVSLFSFPFLFYLAMFLLSLFRFLLLLLLILLLLFNSIRQNVTPSYTDCFGGIWSPILASYAHSHALNYVWGRVRVRGSVCVCLCTLLFLFYRLV